MVSSRLWPTVSNTTTTPPMVTIQLSTNQLPRWIGLGPSNINSSRPMWIGLRLTAAA